MTREEIKNALPILQAFAEGKVIQYKDQGVWRDITTDEGLFVENAFVNYNDYRIKPESKYHPFANAEECWQEMLKHQPVGWVKVKDECKLSIYCNIDSNCDFEADFDDYTFADGAVFGIKED